MDKLKEILKELGMEFQQVDETGVCCGGKKTYKHKLLLFARNCRRHDFVLYFDGDGTLLTSGITCPE